MTNANDLLQRIQELQFVDQQAAEALLLDFVRASFPLNVITVSLRPQAVSLNSFNGFLTLHDGSRYFFKTHTEPDTVIGEYYNAEILANAGYPVIRARYSSTEPGRQLLIYDVIDAPSLFEAAWEIEQGDDTYSQAITEAQHAADEQLLSRYLASLQIQTAEEAALAPIHQLFFHRLVGGRLARFYGDMNGQNNSPEIIVRLPDDLVGMSEVGQARWEINGQRYAEPINVIISRSTHLLNPMQSGPAIVGHGDAHNGNLFYFGETRSPALIYFDPAFAGKHHPLLDIAKPLFHNVFAMWMYFPAGKRKRLNIRLRREAALWRVQHDYELHPIREMFLHSKITNVLIPIVRELSHRDWLCPEWRLFLKAALFCCPFLTMNLADSNRFSPEIRLLGLAMAVEMGAESIGKRSVIDSALDEVERAAFNN